MNKGFEQQNAWDLFEFFPGAWEAVTEGCPGLAEGVQEYQFVLNSTFLQVKNKSIFERQENSPEGEIHEDWGFFSYDQNRKKFVLRQFHGEGFVNQYVLDSISDDGKTLVFITENIENIPDGWQARLTYHILCENEFQQIFELAAPGKDFKVYNKGQLRRKV